MARIRTVKPEFFRHSGLYDAEKETGLPLRIAFAGLWTVADREGRFRWKPREIKLDILPYDDVDISRVLDALTTRGFIRKYTLDHVEYGCIPSWSRHQVINNRESESCLPECPQVLMIEGPADACPTRAPRDTDLHVHAIGEGEGKGKGKEEEKNSADGAAAPPKTPRKKEPVPEGYKEFVDALFQLNGGKYVFTSKDGASIKRLLASIGKDEAIKRLGTYYHKDHWFTKEGRSLGGFVAHVNELVEKDTRPKEDPEIAARRKAIDQGRGIWDSR